MSTLGTLSCLANAGNTGVQGCFFDPKQLFGAILTPKGYQFDVTSFTTNLSAGLYNVSKSARLYPVYDFETPKDSSGTKKIQEMANGQRHVVREDFNQWAFQYVQGGLSLHQNLRRFNGSNYDFYFLDSDPATGQRIIGITGSTGTMLRAFPSDGGYFWAEPWKLNTGAAITEYMLEFVFAQKYSNDFVNFASAPSLTFDFPTALPGLQDLILSSPSANATPGSFNVAVKSPLGTDIASLQAAVLNVLGLWTCINTLTGATIPITGVTFVAGTGGAPGYFTLAVTTTAPPYPTGTQTVTINLAPPATLVAAGLDYESTGGVAIVKS